MKLRSLEQIEPHIALSFVTLGEVGQLTDGELGQHHTMEPLDPHFPLLSLLLIKVF